MANEMSESLRRNLLWERQLSRRILGMTKRDKDVKDAKARVVDGVTPGTSRSEEERAEAAESRAKLLRNKSWANDYHHSGW